jgi:hypothetical protein
MAVNRLTTWVAGEILTASDLNGEFDNILNTGQLIGFPRTQAADFDGQTLQLDADGNTTLRANTDDEIDIAIGGTDTFLFTAQGLYYLGSRLLTQSDQAHINAQIFRLSTLEARLNQRELDATLESQIFS